MGPARLIISEALIDVSRGDGMRVIVRDAHLSVAGEVPVDVSLPYVEAPIDFGALFSGKISFSSLTIDRPLVSLGVPGVKREVPSVNRTMEAVNRVSDVVEAEFARRKLKHVTVQNGELKIHGVLVRSFFGIDAQIFWDQDRSIRAMAKVAGRTEPWTIQFAREAPLDGGDRRIAVLVSDITLAEIFKPDAVPKPRRGLGIPLQAKFEALLSGDGTFQSANLVGQAADGLFHVGPTPIRFDNAALSLAWIGESPKIKITRSHAIRGNTQIFFSGEIEPPAASSADWNISLATELAQFGSSDVPLPPFMLDDFKLNGRFEPESRTLFLDKVSLSAGRAKAYYAGSLQLRDDGPYLALATEVEDIPIGLAKHLWPITLVPPARTWVIGRIKTGMIEHGNLDIVVRPPGFDRSDPDSGWSGDDFTASLTFNDARLAPIGNMPEIYNLAGTLTVENEVMTVKAANGLIYTGSGSQVAVPDVEFQILHLPEKHNKLGVIDVDLVGGAREIGRIIDSKPFQVLKRTNLTSQAFSGEGSLHIHAEFPLKKKLDMAQVVWKAEAVSDNISLNQPVQGHTIKNAAVKLVADPRQVAITGKGVLDGLEADIDLLFPLGGSGIEARQGAVISVTADQLKARGIDLISILDGPMMLTVDQVETGKTFDVDLTKATVRLEPFGWSKSKGVPAIASFRLVEKDDLLLIEDFQLQSDGVDVNGSLTLTKSGILETASFATFQLRAGDETSVSVQRSGKGRYKAVMIGDSFDARGLIRQMRKPANGDAGDSYPEQLSITANLTRVTGFSGARLDDFTGMVEVTRDGVRQADLSGSIDGRAPFSFVLKPSGTVREAKGNFGDAGAMLKFLDLYKRMRGGSGRLLITMHDTTTWDGTFKVREMSITEDPAIKRLSTDPELWRSRDLSAKLGASTAGKSGESSFQRLDVFFTRSGDTVTITRGALQGAVLGGTVEGTMDLKTQTLELTGTFVPMFALNNIFAKIPLLGFALGGRSEEGLIGVTYRVTGPVSDPEIRVNPISAIAPGIFRKVFEFH